MYQQSQPYNQGQITRQRRSRSNFNTGPRCPICNSTDIRPFASIYGFGTTNYLSSRGLIISHGFQRTKRQTVLAANCAPPKKLPWWPTIFVLVFAGASYVVQNILPRISDLLELARYWMLWIALALAMITAIQNYAFHPSRMAAWGRKLFCQKCGTSFESHV